MAVNLRPCPTSHQFAILSARNLTTSKRFCFRSSEFSFQSAIPSKSVGLLNFKRNYSFLDSNKPRKPDFCFQVNCFSEKARSVNDQTSSDIFHISNEETLCSPEQQEPDNSVPDIDAPVRIAHEDWHSGALRSIQVAERQCREAAKKLLEAQSRLESARLIAAELQASPISDLESYQNLQVVGLQDPSHPFDTGEISSSTEDESWRDRFSAVNAVMTAEEQRRARMELFEAASNTLSKRLQESQEQVSFNDQYIELLDRGGQYHVAQWVINEVEGCVPPGAGRKLVVSINLSLALQGCDSQTAKFLQELPYDEVLGIEAFTGPVSAPVIVDYSDGSSWEDAGFETEEGLGRWTFAESDSGAAIDVDFVNKDLKIDLQGQAIMESSVSPVKAILIHWKEVLACALAFSYSVIKMTMLGDPRALLFDVLVISVTVISAFAASCLTGMITPRKLQALKNRVIHNICISVEAQQQTDSRVNGRPWDKVVFWMTTMAAVLSAATMMAGILKAIQSVVLMITPLCIHPMVHHVSSTSIKQLFNYLGVLSTTHLFQEFLPYLVSAVAWLLMVCSVAVATTSASLVLIGYTSHIPKEI